MENGERRVLARVDREALARIAPTTFVGIGAVPSFFPSTVINVPLPERHVLARPVARMHE